MNNKCMFVEEGTILTVTSDKPVIYSNRLERYMAKEWLIFRTTDYTQPLMKWRRETTTACS